MPSGSDMVMGLLGAGGGLSVIFTVVDKWRNRKFTKLKEEGSVKLDEATYTEIASRAAKINTEDRIKIEKWWKEQFETVKRDLAEQQRWRRRAVRRWQEHKQWDDKQALRIHELTGQPVDPAPSLDPDDDDPFRHEKAGGPT
jgi:superfamily I DNA and/or RNA helicase